MSLLRELWLPIRRLVLSDERRWTHAVVPQVMGSALLVLIMSDCASGQPAMLVNPRRIDWGIAYVGELKSAYVTIANAGNERLDVYAIRPSCGCTTTSKPNLSILPAAKDSFLVQFDSFGSRGPLLKEVEIESSDPHSRRIVIPVHVVVREELQPVMLSSIHWMGEIMVGSVFQDTIYLRNVSSKQIRFLWRESKADAMTLKTLNAPIGPNDSIAVQIIVGTVRAGEQSLRFDLQTDSDGQQLVPLIIAYRGIEKSDRGASAR